MIPELFTAFPQLIGIRAKSHPLPHSMPRQKRTGCIAAEVHGQARCSYRFRGQWNITSGCRQCILSVLKQCGHQTCECPEKSCARRDNISAAGVFTQKRSADSARCRGPIPRTASAVNRFSCILHRSPGKVNAILSRFYGHFFSRRYSQPAAAARGIQRTVKRGHICPQKLPGTAR